MKGSFVLSIGMDVLAIVLLLLPDAKYRRFSTNERTIALGKRICFFVLILGGFLIDRYITHGAAH